MRWVVDTNILSEVGRRDCHPAVAAWARHARDEALYVSVVTLAEIRYGIDRAPSSERRRALRDWLDNEIRPWFAGRVLDLDEDALTIWRGIATALGRSGRPPSAPDALIAATARRHRCGVVSRNVRDFLGMGVPLLDPVSGLRHAPGRAP
jgi:toxin FitB